MKLEENRDHCGTEWQKSQQVLYPRVEQYLPWFSEKRCLNSWHHETKMTVTEGNWYWNDCLHRVVCIGHHEIKIKPNNWSTVPRHCEASYRMLSKRSGHCAYSVTGHQQQLTTELQKKTKKNKRATSRHRGGYFWMPENKRRWRISFFGSLLQKPNSEQMDDRRSHFFFHM